jgi:hypothetical protein
MTPLQKLIFDALNLSYRVACEGITFSKWDDFPEISAEQFLMAYSMTTGDEDWSNFALRLSMRVAEMEHLEQEAYEQSFDD